MSITPFQAGGYGHASFLLPSDHRLVWQPAEATVAVRNGARTRAKLTPTTF